MTNYKANSYSPQDIPLVFLVELVLREKGVEAQMAMFEKLGKALGPTYALEALGHTMQDFWGSGRNLFPSPASQSKGAKLPRKVVRTSNVIQHGFECLPGWNACH